MANGVVVVVVYSSFGYTKVSKVRSKLLNPKTKCRKLCLPLRSLEALYNGKLKFGELKE